MVRLSRIPVIGRFERQRNEFRENLKPQAEATAEAQRVFSDPRYANFEAIYQGARAGNKKQLDELVRLAPELKADVWILREQWNAGELQSADRVAATYLASEIRTPVARPAPEQRPTTGAFNARSPSGRLPRAIEVADGAGAQRLSVEALTARPERQEREPVELVGAEVRNMTPAEILRLPQETVVVNREGREITDGRKDNARVIMTEAGPQFNVRIENADIRVDIAETSSRELLAEIGNGLELLFAPNSGLRNVLDGAVPHTAERLQVQVREGPTRYDPDRRVLELNVDEVVNFASARADLDIGIAMQVAVNTAGHSVKVPVHGGKYDNAAPFARLHGQQRADFVNSLVARVNESTQARTNDAEAFRVLLSYRTETLKQMSKLDELPSVQDLARFMPPSVAREMHADPAGYAAHARNWVKTQTGADAPASSGRLSKDARDNLVNLLLIETVSSDLQGFAAANLSTKDIQEIATEISTGITRGDSAKRLAQLQEAFTRFSELFSGAVGAHRSGIFADALASSFSAIERGKSLDPSAAISRADVMAALAPELLSQPVARPALRTREIDVAPAANEQAAVREPGDSPRLKDLGMIKSTLARGKAQALTNQLGMGSPLSGKVTPAVIDAFAEMAHLQKVAPMWRNALAGKDLKWESEQELTIQQAFDRRITELMTEPQQPAAVDTGGW